MTASVSNQNNNFLKALFYGGCVQVSTLVFTHPFDRIKTYQQSQLINLSTLQAVKNLISKNGFHDLYSGFRFNAMNGFFKGGIRWSILSTFERIYKVVLPHEFDKKHPLARTALIAVTISTIETPWICAMEALKTREMTQTERKMYPFKILKNEGFSFLTRGGKPVLIRQITSWGSFLLPLEIFSEYVKSRSENGHINSFDKLVISAGASFVNVIVTNPVDVLKTKIQQHNSPYVYNSVYKCSWSILSKEGLNGFSKGLNLRFVSSQIHATVSIYMMMMLGFYRYEA